MELVAPLYSFATTLISLYFARRHLLKGTASNRLWSQHSPQFWWINFVLGSATCLIDVCVQCFSCLHCPFEAFVNSAFFRIPIDSGRKLSVWHLTLHCFFFTAFCGFCASALSGLITKVSSFCLSLFPETPVFFLVLEVFLPLCSEYYAFSLSHYVHHALILADVTSIFLRVVHCSRILILNRI